MVGISKYGENIWNTFGLPYVTHTPCKRFLGSVRGSGDDIKGEIEIRKDKKRWGVVTSRRRALDAALVLDYLITHDAHFLCDRDTMPACAHVVQSICLQVNYDMHTSTATSACGCAQLLQGGDHKDSHGRGRHQQDILRATYDR